MDRRVVYIRARGRPRLYFRFTGGQYAEVRQVLYPDRRREHHSYYLAVGDWVVVEFHGRIHTLEVGEDSDITDEEVLAASSHS